MSDEIKVKQPKRGGRKKGTPNKKPSKERQLQAASNLKSLSKIDGAISTALREKNVEMLRVLVLYLPWLSGKFKEKDELKPEEQTTEEDTDTNTLLSMVK